MLNVIWVFLWYLGQVLLWLLFATFIWGLLARLVWWGSGRRAYLPSVSLCMGAHKALMRWGIALRGFRRTQVLVGLLAMPVWLSLILVNLIFLAQILELVFPSGQPVVLPWFGRYYTYPLAAGFLFAVAETTLGILLGVFDDTRVKRGLGCLWFAMVLMETGLATYRAWLIMTGQEPMTQSVFDRSMRLGGPLLGGFLGFTIPISHTVLGYCAFHWFVDPLVLLLGWLLTWWTLGFHDRKPLILPTSVAWLMKEWEQLKADKDQLQRKVKALEQEAPPIRPRDLAQVDDELKYVREQIKEVSEGWDKRAADTQKEMKAANSYKVLLGVARRISRDRIQILQEVEQLTARIEKLEGELRRAVDVATNYARDLEGRGRRILRAQTKCSTLQRTQQALAAEQQALAAKQQALAAEINQLNNAQGDDPIEQLWAAWALAACDNELHWLGATELPAMNNEISALNGRLEGLSDDQADREKKAPKVPSEADVDQLLNKLLELFNDLERRKKTALDCLAQLSDDCRSASRRLRVPLWKQVLGALLPGWWFDNSP